MTVLAMGLRPHSLSDSIFTEIVMSKQEQTQEYPGELTKVAEMLYCEALVKTARDRGYPYVGESEEKLDAAIGLIEQIEVLDQKEAEWKEGLAKKASAELQIGIG
jgi:hypothetical protein